MFERTRNRTAMTAPRGIPHPHEAGFTLIELLVVVIIIGILAAIAIPVYIGVQNNAKDSTLKSDLVNAKTALVALGTDANGAVPTSVTKAGAATVAGVSKPLDKYGWSVSTNTADLVYSTSTAGVLTTWCVLGTSATGNKFSISSNTQILGGTATSGCPTTY